MTLSAFAAGCRAAMPWLLSAAAVDPYVLPAGHLAANPPHAAAAVELLDSPFTDTVPHTMQPMPNRKSSCQEYQRMQFEKNS